MLWYHRSLDVYLTGAVLIVPFELGLLHDFWTETIYVEASYGILFIVRLQKMSMEFLENIQVHQNIVFHYFIKNCKVHLT